MKGDLLTLGPHEVVDDMAVSVNVNLLASYLYLFIAMSQLELMPTKLENYRKLSKKQWSKKVCPMNRNNNAVKCLDLATRILYKKNFF